MRPLEHIKRKADLLDLVCQLIEQPGPMIGAGVLEPHGDVAERLIEIGLLLPGTAPSTIVCRACDEDHAATPEFDSAARRYFHFCPIAGQVAIDSRDLETLEIRPRALVDLLLTAFPVLPAIGNELVIGKVWHLGEAVIGGTSLTLMFARRIGSRRSLGALSGASDDVPVTEIGMIVTSSRLPDPKLALPNRYMVVSLRDIANFGEDGFTINRERLVAHIRARRATPVRLRPGGGRISSEDVTADAYYRRRQRGEPFASNAAEARAIVSELAKAHSDRAPLGLSTVRRHIARLRAARP